MDKAILPACYLPPIPYFSCILKNAGSGILIEQYEHYPKQTYRSRASIYGANGKLDLIIPVKKGNRDHTRMKDVRISYDADWQRLHWLSLQTAYRSSAYFEFYEDDFARFYERQYPFLLEYNLELTRMILSFLKIDTVLSPTDSYQAVYPVGILDMRDKIHPKIPIESDLPPYRQVFSDRHGFIAGLSIVDLLFNHGPQSRALL